MFDRAVDLDPAAQAAFLDDRCGGDAGLRAAVDELLRLDRRVEAGELLLRSPVAEARRTTRPGTAPRFGRYRVVRVLGEGGMGTVYEAEQDNPRRAVALKVIRAGLGTGPLRERFAREAQILGRLRHPGLAQVYDAGVAETGQPYFAMELVAGVPLDQYVRERAPDPGARLELVARVCDAVQHAHDGGVVHRDLKPGNILVEPSGRPKVIDFGVARAADAGRTAGGAVTEAGQLIGTLNYMSPEQASGDPSAIDPRGDVYALGVILYELLADRRPYRLDGLPLPEAVRRDPRGGSVAARGLRRPAPRRRRDDRRQGAREGSGPTLRLGRRPGGGPPAPPESRGHPARPPSALYQLCKFARRHRAIVAAAAGVMVALSAGTLVSALYAIRADENAREARENARQARYQTYRANLAAAASALSQHDVTAAGRHLAAAPEELRGWEWRHLQARLDDSTAVLPTGQVLRRGRSGFRVATFGKTSLVVTDEGRRQLLSAPWPFIPGSRPMIHFGDDATWRIAEIVDRPGGLVRLIESSGRDRALRLPPGRKGADTLRFSPDGTRLAVLELNHSVSLWDVPDGQRRSTWPGTAATTTPCPSATTGGGSRWPPTTPSCPSGTRTPAGSSSSCGPTWTG